MVEWRRGSRTGGERRSSLFWLGLQGRAWPVSGVAPDTANDVR